MLSTFLDYYRYLTKENQRQIFAAVYMLNLRPPSNENQTLDVKERKTMTQSAWRLNCQAPTPGHVHSDSLERSTSLQSEHFYVLVYYYHQVFYLFLDFKKNVCECFIYMYVHHVSKTPCLVSRNPRREYWIHRTWMTDSYDPLCKFWELNLSPLQKQQVLLIINPPV